MTASSLYEFLTSDAQEANYASLVDAVLFTGLDSQLQAAHQLLFAPNEEAIKTLEATEVVWNKQLATSVLKNHVHQGDGALPEEPEVGQSDSYESLLAGEELEFKKTKDGENDVLEVNGVVAVQNTRNDNIAVYDIDEILEIKDVVYSIDNINDGPVAVALDVFGSDSLSMEVTDVLTNINPASACEDDTAVPTKIFCSKRGITVFLPSADAFEKLSDEAKSKKGYDEFIDDGGLNYVLKNHIVNDATPVDSTTYTSMGGKEIVVNLASTEQAVSIDGVGTTVENTPDNYSNGQVHIIEKVLVFPRKTTVEVVKDVASELFTQVTEAELVTDLDIVRSTIFAPTNEAFGPLLAFAKWDTATVTKDDLKNILKFHLMDSRVYSEDLDVGKELTTLNDDEVIKVDNSFKEDVKEADILATNGNIHIINKVLIPDMYVKKIPTVDIVGLAEEATPELAKLIAAADLADTLSDLSETFTVFAPSDDAFAKMNNADIEFLKKAENVAILKKLLTYHVVNGSPILSSALVEKQDVTSVEGSKYEVTKSDEDVFVNGKAKVTTADNKAFNGVVHIVDDVLIPNDVFEQLPSQSSTASSLSFSAAVIGVVSLQSAAF